MCTGLCRKLRRRYCLVLVLSALVALIIARRNSPAVESEIESVEKTLTAELSATLGNQALGPTQAATAAPPNALAPPLPSAAQNAVTPALLPPPAPPASNTVAPPATTAPAPPTPSTAPPAEPAKATPTLDVPAGADPHSVQPEWKSIGLTRKGLFSDAIDVDPILAQLSYDNPWNPAPSGSKGIGSWTQGWDVKYDDAEFKQGDPLKVFVMPHSHNDPGWLWSFEGYYQKYTGGIITTVIKALKSNPGRRFIWAEISFFELWWQHQSEQMKQNARDVVASGQLEFVTAGWVMNDEANCDTYGILEQLYEGREWVEDTFGVQPSTGYAVDPFGQSAVMAHVLKRMGYQAMYINRVQYAIKRVLAEQHNMDFIWRQHWDTAGSTDMMVHMHPFFNYDVPHSCGPQPGVCCQFDFLRLETPGMTCPWGVKPEPISSRNVAERSRTYLDQIKKKATVFGGRSGRAHSVLVPIGGDLEYQHDSIATKMYENYEAMFAHINKDPSYNVQIQFGTLKDYFDSLAADYAKETNLRVLSGPSFFTYADKDEEYWSGYYTSRPFYKSINRELEGLLHAAQLLHSSFIHPSVESAGAAEAESGIRTAKRAMALFQHHDAITGTSKHATMDDYGKKLYSAVVAMQCLIAASLKQLASLTAGGLQFHEIRQSDKQLPTRTTLSFPSEGTVKMMVLFNPTGRKRTNYLHQAVDSANVCVRDVDGTLQPSQIDPLYRPDLSARAAGFELISPVEVPAFAMRVVEIVRDSKCAVTMASVWQSSGGAEPEFPAGNAQGGSFELKNAQIECTFQDGLLHQMRPTTEGAKPTVVNERFMYYRTSKSGAYIFLPNGQAAAITPALSRVVRGPFVQTAHTLVGSTNVARLARLAGDDMGLVVEHYVDVTAQSNEEWIVRYDTDYQTGRTLFTELNSWTTDRHIIRDDRQIPVQTKYFPMPGGAFIEDANDHRRFSMQAGQPCGVGSMSEGSVEVMLDRRLTKDDARGMNEAMNDNLPTMNRLVLLVENANAPIPNARSAAPSLASLQAAEALNRPILRLLEPNDPPASMSTTRVTTTVQAQSAADWPCELSMDALKLGRHTTTSVRARLARRSYDSRFSAPPGCSTLPTGDSVATHTLFTSTPAATEGVTALTMGGAVDPATKSGSDQVFLPEMEWATVQWEWPDRPQGAKAGCGGSISAPRVVGPTSQQSSALSPGNMPATGNSECEFEDSVDWLPSSDEVRPASSKEACCAVCHSTSGCKVGVFVAQQCWLKFNIGGGKVSAPGAVSCKLK